MASSILTVPSPERLAKLSKRFKEVDPSAVTSVHLFIHVAIELTNDLEKFFGGHDLSTGRFSLLMVLYRDTALTLKQSEIAKILKVKPATMTGLIDGLEKQAYVRRENDPSDRRGSLIRITNSGIKFLEKVLPDYFTRMSELMANISTAERAAFSRTLQKTRENIGAMSK